MFSSFCFMILFSVSFPDILYSLNPSSCIPGPCRRCSWPWFCFDSVPPPASTLQAAAAAAGCRSGGGNGQTDQSWGENRTVNSRGAYPYTFSDLFPRQTSRFLNPYHLIPLSKYSYNSYVMFKTPPSPQEPSLTKLYISQSPTPHVLFFWNPYW